MIERDRDNISTVVLAGNTKIKRQLRRRKRKGFFYRVMHPDLWNVDRRKLESRISSRINRDDYIVGENKSLLYLHPDLISQPNINFLKRVLYFAGKTGDRIYSRNKKDLLKYLSTKGRASITMVLEAVNDTPSLNRDWTVVVGPETQLRKELHREGLEGFEVMEQGNSVGDNILIGRDRLKEMGFRGKQMLVLGGDIPLLNGSNLSTFLNDALGITGDPEIRFGMGSRTQLGEFIMDHDLASMGKVGPNHPKKGNLNKFGIPLLDREGIFGRKNGRDHLMMGNMFLVKFDRISGRFIDRFYTLRKMGANPLTYPYLLKKFGRPLFRAVRWKLSIREAEEAFKRATGVDLRVSPVEPDLTMDLDSYTDLRRLSALYFHRFRTTHDLETDLKDFAKGKRRERRKASRSGSGDA